MSLLDEIATAFAERVRPVVLTERHEPLSAGRQGLSSDERREVESFEGVRWSNVSCQLLEKNDSVFYHFSTSAFCYFLPGIISAGIRENNSDLQIYDSMILTLDRTANPDYWDDFFLSRWPHLRIAEIDVVQSWILWLCDHSQWGIHENTLERALDTIGLVRDQVPSAPVVRA